MSARRQAIYHLYGRVSGRGKTEWAKRLVKTFDADDVGVAHIDADEFRKYFEGYTGANSFLFQNASSILLDRAYKHALKHKKSCIVDTTFSKVGTALSNVGESLNHQRSVEIIYVYQHPSKAWEFVQVREREEGRNIQLETFVDKFLLAPTVVDEVKKKYGQKILVTLVEKDWDNPLEAKVTIDVSSLEKRLKVGYTKDELIAKLS